jgi:hypothetical protein
MDALARRQHHARVRVLSHVKRLDDCFADLIGLLASRKRRYSLRNIK